MIKVPINSYNSISIVYYIYDKQNKLMYKGNLQLCKVFCKILSKRVSDIVAFYGMYRYEVWSIEEWISITGKG